MATERVTTRSDGVTSERTVERDGGGTTYVDRGGSGMGALVISIAVLAVVAIIAFFLLTANRDNPLRTDAVTSAASTVADSTASPAGAVNPSK